MLVEKMKRQIELRRELTQHIEAAKTREGELRQSIRSVQREIDLASAGIDKAQIDLAKMVIFVRGSFERAGEDRESVVADALYQIATNSVPAGRQSLDQENYGTKDYDRWSGQRCDCEPFMGPRHGSIVFQVGITDALRRRGGVAAMTDDEREAAAYLLSRLELAQAIDAKAMTAA
jgi:hypothetical protein